MTYEILELFISRLNYNDLINKDTPLICLCKNRSLTYEILELFISKLNYYDLIIKGDWEYTALICLCRNESITYEILELFLYRLNYNDLLVSDNREISSLMCLCKNRSITYEMLEFFVSKLNQADLYIQDNNCEIALAIANKLDYYKLFITNYINVEEFIDIIGFEEYTKYKIEIDDYFEIVNNYYDLK